MSCSQKKLFEEICETSELHRIQKYVEDVLELRGFVGQTPQDKMLLLIEEIGELAKAIRKTETTMAIDLSRIQHYDTIESEVADVFIVLISLCNVIGINIYDAFLEKERINIGREWNKWLDK